MKQLAVLSTLFLNFFIFTSCNSTKLNENTSQNIHRKWMMVEYKGFTKEELIQLNAFVDLTKNAENKNNFGAKMGCNNIFFTTEFKNNNRIVFSKIGSTEMYCQDAMKLEDQFGKDLPSMNSFKIEGHFLTLSNEKGKTMKFVAEDWD